MEKNSEFFEIVDRHFLNRHYNKTDKNRSYAEHQTVSHLLKRAFFRINLKTSESEIINIISKLFYQYLGINLPLEKMIRDTVSAFIVERDFYSRLLRKRKVKKVYLVCSYGIEALISACTLNHVECLELQHGTMSRYHLGYSFPNSSSIPYFPDILFLFGDYWRDNTPIPLSKTRLISIGYHYLETQLKQYIVCKKKKNQIIIISQGTIGKDLTRIISVFAKNNPKYAIVYKLHPGECPRWKTEYQELAEAARLSNFSIVDNSEVSLYQLLGESEYAVGVYSTAIYEALVLNCKIILVDLPGVEYMDYLITNNYAKLAQTSDQIKKCLLEGNFKTAEREYFFKPFGFSSEIN
ncbi:MAG: hypothetical protein JW904_03690 [Spirochaetales bacterium]|nr:hypothetical protein [Spirochaetales bacterium]